MTATDTGRIAVVGAGVIGTMTAWFLAKRGFDVTVFDQWNTPNDRGASAGESRIFRTIYKESPEYVPILQKSKQLWDELQTNQQKQVLDMCGGLTIGRPDHADVAAVINCARVHDLDHRILDRAEMASRYPQYRLDDDEVGVHDPGAGVFRPEPAVLAARNEAQRLGARFRSYTRVLGIRSLGSQVMVDTADGAMGFDKIVLSTGPWVNELSDFGVDTVAPRRLVAMWFPAADIELHSPKRMPISIRRHDKGGFSCFPVLDGMGVKILPHHLPWRTLDQVDDLPRFIEPEIVKAAESAVAGLMPGLEPTAVRVSTWSEGFAGDDTPIVGPSAADDRIVLAVGMSGQGFKFSPMIGSIVTDYVEKGQSPDAIALMHPQRFNAEPSIRGEMT